jgi:hypothetical protein
MKDKTTATATEKALDGVTLLELGEIDNKHKSGITLTKREQEILGGRAEPRLRRGIDTRNHPRTSGTGVCTAL